MYCIVPVGHDKGFQRIKKKITIIKTIPTLNLQVTKCCAVSERENFTKRLRYFVQMSNFFFHNFQLFKVVNV